MTSEKPSRNEDEYFARQEAELLRRQRDDAAAARTAAERRSHHMKCPKDGSDLVTRDIHGVQVETCSECGGMWLDAGELEALGRHQEPGLLGRVVGDVLSSFGGRRKRPDAGGPTHEPGNPLA